MGFQYVSIWVVGFLQNFKHVLCCISTWKHGMWLCPGKTIVHSQTTDVESVDVDEEDEEGEGQLRPHLSSSTPDIHTIHTTDKQEGRDSGLSDDSDVVQKFVRGAKFVCRVIEDFIPTNDQPSCIPLRVSSRHCHYWHHQDLTIIICIYTYFWEGMIHQSVDLHVHPYLFNLFRWIKKFI